MNECQLISNVIYQNDIPIFKFRTNSHIYAIRNKYNKLLGYIAKGMVGLNHKEYVVVNSKGVFQRTSILTALNLIEGILKKDYKKWINNIG